MIRTCRSALFAAVVVLASVAWLTAVQMVPAQTVEPPAPRPEKEGEPLTPPPNPTVVIETSMGTIKVQLWPDKAKATVGNFLTYVDDKFYDGLIFHRVISGFMIQGGGFTEDMKQVAPRAPVKNEARKDVPNSRGTLAMARTMVVDSATSQFFINLVDNSSLNHRDKTPRGFGYCVFGKVTEGMDVVDKIAKVPTGTRGPHRDVPQQPVKIVGIRREAE